VQVLDSAAQQYLDGVRAALADLPPGEVDEILDDVRAHLVELSAELGPDPDRDALAARLGTPAAYAAELRAAAGYPPPPAPAPLSSGSSSGSSGSPPAPPGRGAARLAVVGLVIATLLVPAGLLNGSVEGMAFGAAALLLALPALVREGPRMTAVAELPELRGLLTQHPRGGLLGDLQSAWWVARALIAAALVGTAFLDTGWPAVLLLAVVAVPVSVWLGRRSRVDRRLLWVVVPLNALALALVAVTGLWAAPRPASDSEPASAYPTSPGLWQDGAPVLDIRPVDAAGRPLTGVYLFDQDGRPIVVESYDCEGYYAGDGYADDGYGGAGTAAGSAQPYPRGTWETDPDTGRCVLVPPGPLVVAVPTPTASATAPTAPTAPTVPPGAATPTAAVPVEPAPTAAPSAGVPAPTAPAAPTG
jgi:HAAS domain-containing protein